MNNNFIEQRVHTEFVFLLYFKCATTLLVRPTSYISLPGMIKKTLCIIEYVNEFRTSTVAFNSVNVAVAIAVSSQNIY
jgi:hypothetical protein